MKKYFIASIVILFFAKDFSFAQTQNMLTEKEKKEGWQLLFDGKTLNGWKRYGHDKMGTGWKVTDGAIHLDPATRAKEVTDGCNDIVTEKEFGNFDLKLEWKISKNGNSGIMFYVHEDTVRKWPWETGPEMQVLDNDGHPDGKIHKHRAGDLYDLVACSKETVKPVGEWNEVEIKSLNGKLDFFLNGVNVISTTLWNDDWKKMIADSKFKTMPGFGTFRKGKIALQDHGGDEVWFRNIKIKKP